MLMVCLEMIELLNYGLPNSEICSPRLIHMPMNILAEKLSALDITSYDLETLEISPGAVLDSIKKLKRGKSDGGDLLSDHLIFSPCSFVALLAPITTSLLRHGYMPPCFSDAFVQ